MWTSPISGGHSHEECAVDLPETETLADFQKLKQDIEAERTQRIRQYRREIKALTRRKRLSGSGPVKILVEGDSWFDYPLSRDTIGCLRRLVKNPELMLSLAHFGDTAEVMLSLEQRERLRKMLASSANGEFEALLFSGGGNDLAGNQFCLWLRNFDFHFPDPSNGIDYQRLADIMGVVKAALVDIILMRNDTRPNCIIFFHGYDFPVPDGRPALCLPKVGPWLKPSLDFRGWTNRTAASAIIKTILESYSALLMQLSAEYDNVVYVPTQ